MDTEVVQTETKNHEIGLVSKSAVLEERDFIPRRITRNAQVPHLGLIERRESGPKVVLEPSRKTIVAFDSAAEDDGISDYEESWAMLGSIQSWSIPEAELIEVRVLRIGHIRKIQNIRGHVLAVVRGQDTHLRRQTGYAHQRLQEPERDHAAGQQESNTQESPGQETAGVTNAFRRTQHAPLERHQLPAQSFEASARCESAAPFPSTSHFARMRHMIIHPDSPPFPGGTADQSLLDSTSEAQCTGSQQTRGI